jgi:hypothetical protein
VTGRATSNRVRLTFDRAIRLVGDLPAAKTTNLKGETFTHPTLVSRYDVLEMLSKLAEGDDE